MYNIEMLTAFKDDIKSEVGALGYEIIKLNYWKYLLEHEMLNPYLWTSTGDIVKCNLIYDKLSFDTAVKTFKRHIRWINAVYDTDLWVTPIYQGEGDE